MGEGTRAESSGWKVVATCRPEAIQTGRPWCRASTSTASPTSTIFGARMNETG